uniref:ABC transporter ATP-binding protein n=1 Tax=Herbidospora sakaeratensis TaxID=564415 RepID=UPI0007C81EB8|nr:ABC transporter ATP-binding protein [Herbidospora sakaeratensis]
MIELRELDKIYSRPALSKVSLGLHEGVVALLGRNGAGKSTLLSILAGLAVQTGGGLALNGRELGRSRRALREAATLLPQDPRFDPAVSARTLIRHLLRLRRRKAAIEELLEVFGLTSVADAPLGTLSGGTRQRVGLVYAFAADTPVLLLDEPTQGLDPWERLRFADHLATSAGGKLIVYSTHVISDVEALADRVVVLDDGRVVHDGSPAELLKRAPAVWTAEVPDLSGLPLVTSVRRTADGLRARWTGDRATPRAEPAEPSLTDAYLAITGGR